MVARLEYWYGSLLPSKKYEDLSKKILSFGHPPDNTFLIYAC